MSTRSSTRQPTAGEECQSSARQLSAFIGSGGGQGIPQVLFSDCFGVAILKGPIGVSLVRLPTGDWSAPLAIRIHTNSQNAIQPLQETILLFMSDASCSALVAKSSAVFNQTLRFSPGPFGYAPYDPAVDVFAYVRFNQGFTPAELVMNHMNGWSIYQDEARHEFWHGKDVTWYDVITNKISVDRSSVGNALYVVMNLAGASIPTTKARNYARISEPVRSAPVKPDRLRSQQQQSLIPTSVSSGELNSFAASASTTFAQPGYGFIPQQQQQQPMNQSSLQGGQYQYQQQGVNLSYANQSPNVSYPVGQGSYAQPQFQQAQYGGNMMGSSTQYQQPPHASTQYQQPSQSSSFPQSGGYMNVGYAPGQMYSQAPLSSVQQKQQQSYPAQPGGVNNAGMMMGQQPLSYSTNGSQQQSQYQQQSQGGGMNSYPPYSYQ